MKQGTGERKRGTVRARVIVAKCIWCEEEFEQTIYNGRATLFCSEKCKKLHYNLKRRISRGRQKSPYLGLSKPKNKVNPLDALLLDLKERGIDYSDYKKAHALSQVERIDVNV